MRDDRFLDSLVTKLDKFYFEFYLESLLNNKVENEENDQNEQNTL